MRYTGRERIKIQPTAGTPAKIWGIRPTLVEAMLDSGSVSGGMIGQGAGVEAGESRERTRCLLVCVDLAGVGLVPDDIPRAGESRSRGRRQRTGFDSRQMPR